MLKLPGTNSQKIINAYNSFLKFKMNFKEELYGNNVGEKIYKSIIKLIQV